MVVGFAFGEGAAVEGSVLAGEWWGAQPEGAGEGGGGELFVLFAFGDGDAGDGGDGVGVAVEADVEGDLNC